MGKNIQKMTHDEVMSAPTLGLNDTFPFKCKACGKCCKQRKDLLLTPYDVFRLARYLGRTPEEIIERRCEVYEGCNSHLPVVRIIPQPPEDSCPYLLKRRCSVHAAKPVLCRVFPLARINKASGVPEYYYSEDSGCQYAGNEPTTVREWVADVASEESERAAAAWTAAVRRLAPVIFDGYEKWPDDQHTKILNALFVTLYLPYDTTQDFALQCEMNVDILCGHLLQEFGIMVPAANELPKRTEDEN